MKVLMTCLFFSLSFSVFAQNPTVLFPGESSPDGEYVCAQKKVKQEPKHTCSIRMSYGFFGKEDAGNDAYVYVDDVLYATFKAYNPMNNCYSAEKLVKDLEMSNKCRLIKNVCRSK